MVFKRNMLNLKSLDDFISPYLYNHKRNITPTTFLFKHSAENNDMVPVISDVNYGVKYPLFMYVGDANVPESTTLPAGSFIADGVGVLSEFIPNVGTLTPGAPVYLVIGRNVYNTGVNPPVITRYDNPTTGLPPHITFRYSQTLDDIDADLLFVEVGTAISSSHVRFNLGYPPIYCVDNGVIKNYREVNPEWFKSAY